ncbi:DUF805 domain-containing protein [Paenibacillus lycopersici]|uniref:DUF805 domain-containing protein n=1 Tax=Paenibacillus lycopersici TaxID=2704462 RepID=A0A6C0G5R8_9BACL|nr:DUF805 domain-containing protein [Paenibacillus lycopersici]QHT63069.1 DUF805 domain-containing protein [Paenibacillus lycopersici]
MEWYLKVLRNYVNFSGRARRTEYWMYVLFSFMASVLLAIADAMLGAGRLLSMLYSLAVLLPSLAVVVRRLHDTGRSGWWYFIILIPIVGAIVLLVFLLLDSEPGMNRYGPNPKGE